jgi:hypothetical protein
LTATSAVGRGLITPVAAGGNTGVINLGLTHPLARILGRAHPEQLGTARVAAHSVSGRLQTSATVRTARSRKSGGYLLDEFADMTRSSPSNGVMWPGILGAVLLWFQAAVRTVPECALQGTMTALAVVEYFEVVEDRVG